MTQDELNNALAKAFAMGTYRNVTELNQDELNELKEDYLFRIKCDEEVSYSEIIMAHEIPNEVIFKEYEGISFVEEDFSCNL